MVRAEVVQKEQDIDEIEDYVDLIDMILSPKAFKDGCLHHGRCNAIFFKRFFCESINVSKQGIIVFNGRISKVFRKK